MKYLIGFIVTVIILTVSLYFILQLWDINMISNENLTRGGLSIMFIAVTSLLLTILVPFFFKNNSKGYDMSGDSVAKPLKR